MSNLLTRALLLALGGCLLTLPSAPADAQRRSAAAPKVDKATQLNALYAEYWDALMLLDPLQATLQGDTRYNDQLPNTLSAAFRQQYLDFNQQWLARVEAVGTDGLAGQDLLSQQIFVRDTRAALSAAQRPGWMLPVNSYYNPATIMALLGSGAGAQPFNSVADYQAWSRRSLGIPALFNQAIENMRAGMAAGVVQPRALMEKVLPQLDAVIAANAEDTLFWGPVRNFPEDFSEQDRQRLSAEYKRMIELRILPAYRALRGFIATEYLPACRDTDGLGALPDGAAWYAQSIAQATTLSRDAGDLHALGLAEVDRLQEQIGQAMKTHRLRGKRARLWQTMHNDRKQRFASADELLAAYRSTDTRVRSQLAPVLPDLPLRPLQIQAVDGGRALTASAASYQPAAHGSEDPGLLLVNTHALQQRPRWAVTMQYLHEGIPGHHLQLGLRQEGVSLPRFRRHTGDTAFVEGWGLYAETLGNELGLYQQPYEVIGYLHGKLVRSARIVADTGLHAQGWSRQKAARYLVEEADLSPAEAALEVERSMAMPGHLLAPRVGELRLLRLREQARQALGERFDLRSFHAEVLRDGSLPLDILETRIAQWIAQPAPATP